MAGGRQNRQKRDIHTDIQTLHHYIYIIIIIKVAEQLCQLESSLWSSSLQFNALFLLVSSFPLSCLASSLLLLLLLLNEGILHLVDLQVVWRK